MKLLLSLLAAIVHLNVFAAASLTTVLPHFDPKPHYQFAGSDQLAFQIGQGAPADLFLAASPRYPDQLYSQGRCSKPAVFATNTVVLIVPRANPAHIHSVADLTRPGIKLVIGAQGVPIGDYTRTVLARLGLSAALENVVSEEPDVKYVVASVALGEADAGFVYLSDVKAIGNKVYRIGLPARAQPTVQYEVCIVHGTRHPRLAGEFVRTLLHRRGREALRAAGFGLP